MTNEDTLLVYNDRLVANNNGLEEILNMINELPEAGSGGTGGGYINDISAALGWVLGGWVASDGTVLAYDTGTNYRLTAVLTVNAGDKLYLSKPLAFIYNDGTNDYTKALEITIPDGVTEVGICCFGADFATFNPLDYIISRTPIETTSNEIYSTEETNTGKTWIDGKAIYRKVFTTTLPTITNNYSGYTSVTIDISSINCEQVISWDGTIAQAGGAAFWNLDWYNSVATASSITNINLTDKVIQIRENSNWLSEGTVIIILEYTKVDG